MARYDTNLQYDYECNECRSLERENSRLQRENADLRAKLAAAEADTKRLAAFILLYANGNFGGDWACVECHPNSDILIDGFQCTYHRAKAIDAMAQDGGRK